MPNEFRKMALGFPEATEGAHMEHPDFRVRGKIFATLWPNGEWGAVLLTPTQQAEFIERNPTPLPQQKVGGDGRATPRFICTRSTRRRCATR